MAQAVALAGRARPSPNPPVGAVVARGDRIVGRGFHRAAGEPHAEVEALRDAGDLARGADLYVTLEPCNHRGRTPPCVQAIVRAGVRRVFVGVRDPNPRVRGGGIGRLRAAGLDVSEGVLAAQCERLVEGFRSHATRGTPFVTLKIASTLDGRIAARDGRSKWITGPASRRRVAWMRARHDAILVGASTVRLDDPRLTVRGPRGFPPPVRVVLTRDAGALDVSRRVLAADDAGVVVLHARGRGDGAAGLRRRGVRTIALPPGPDGFACERDVLAALGKLGIMSVLVEGGAMTFTRFLAAGLADRVCLFVAPLALGGPVERCWYRHEGVSRPAEGLRFERLSVEEVGEDVLIEARPARRARGDA